MTQTKEFLPDIPDAAPKTWVRSSHIHVSRMKVLSGSQCLDRALQTSQKLGLCLNRDDGNLILGNPPARGPPSAFIGARFRGGVLCDGLFIG